MAAAAFILDARMMAGREREWLPGFVTRRRPPTRTPCGGIGWLRRPVRFVERFLRPRLTFLLHRPWLWLPLTLILALTLVMPFMEVIPTSGPIASAVIALLAAGLLTRDGGLVLVPLILLLTVPVAVRRFGFAA